VDVASKICPEERKYFKNICLSRRTVVQRIEMMADDSKTSLKETTSRLEAFSIALDDNTDTAQLAISIGAVDAGFNITEELLALQPLRGTATGQDIFETVNTVFKRFGLKWSSLSGICTDGPLQWKGLIGTVHEGAIELLEQFMKEQ
jgi:hypothetical protein